jgi:Tol biopolymer transport system component
MRDTRGWSFRGTDRRAAIVTVMMAATLGIIEAGPVAGTSPVPVLGGEPWIVYGTCVNEGDGPCGAIFLMRPGGADPHRLVRVVDGSELRATWSPDGSRIAYIQSTADDHPELWVVDADGTAPTRLWRCDRPCNNIDSPDWAPDGGSIIFQYDGDVPDPDSPPTTFAIWRYDLATGEAGPVLTRTGDDLTVEQPRLSPDGTRVVYARYGIAEGTPSALFIADLQGGPERQLTDWDLYAAHPDWSVDDRIVFSSWELRFYPPGTAGGPQDIYTIRADGSDLQDLTNLDDSGLFAGQPRWTPDGTRITYTLRDADASFWCAWIAADGSDRGKLAVFGCGEPELRPTP